MSKEEISEILGDLSAYMDDVLGCIQTLEEDSDKIEGFDELRESIEQSYELVIAAYDNFG